MGTAYCILLRDFNLRSLRGTRGGCKDTDSDMIFTNDGDDMGNEPDTTEERVG